MVREGAGGGGAYFWLALLLSLPALARHGIQGDDERGVDLRNSFFGLKFQKRHLAMPLYGLSIFDSSNDQHQFGFYSVAAVTDVISFGYFERKR